MKWIAHDAKDHKDSFLSAQPFPHIEIKNFLVEEKAVELIKAIANEEFVLKEADLFQFHQTRSLADDKEGFFAELGAFLKSEGKEFFEELSGEALGEQLDLHATIYTDTDYLLCHDDELDDRVIAFLIYLSDMEKQEGGGLALYSADAKNTKEEKVIVPQFNSLAAFRVSKKSLHAVLEVLVDKQRIALGGWFHAK